MKIKDFGTLKIGLTEYINIKKNNKFNSNLYPKII